MILTCYSMRKFSVSFDSIVETKRRTAAAVQAGAYLAIGTPHFSGGSIIVRGYRGGLELSRTEPASSNQCWPRRLNRKSLGNQRPEEQVLLQEF